MSTNNQELTNWVAEVAQMTQPESIVWCDGSESEYDGLVSEMLGAGTLKTLNPDTHPNCFLHLSDPKDVARVEHLTFICT